MDDTSQIKGRLKVLYEERKKAHIDSTDVLTLARTENSEGVAPGLNGDLLARYENSDAVVHDTTLEIEALERQLTAARNDSEIVEEHAQDSGSSVEQYHNAFERWARSTRDNDLKEDGDMQLLNTKRMELRAQGVDVGTAGGFLVPDSFEARLRETMLAFGGAQEAVSTLVTSTGGDLAWPTNDDTLNKGEIIDENTQIGEQDASFGFRTLGSFTYTSKLVRVSWQLQQDASIDIEGFLTRALGVRLARITNEHLTTGTGAAQPMGLVTGVTQSNTAAGASAIVFDDLVDTQHSLDPAYRTPAARWMFSDAVLLELRKIRDDSGGAGVGRPIWEPSVQVGEPSMILGHSYIINQDMTQSVTTGNTTVLYGDFATAYINRQVRGVQVVRLDERYADFLQTGWFGYLRQDGDFDEKLALTSLVQA